MGIVIIVMVSAALFGVGFFLWTTRRAAAGRRGERRLQNADQLRATDPARAMRIYEQLIEQLRARQKKKPLTPAERALLGRAYLGRAYLQLKAGDKNKAWQTLRDAAEFTDTDRESLLPVLVEVYLQAQDVSDEAISAYLTYLRLPVEAAPQAPAARILALLRDQCRIEETTDETTRRRRAQINAALTLLPGPGPRLVIESGAGLGTQVPLRRPLRLGSAPDNDIVIREPAVVAHQAVVSAREDGVWLKEGDDANASPGGAPTPPRRLEDGVHFQVGSVRFGFYNRACITGTELAWPHLNLGVAYLSATARPQAKRAFRKAWELDQDSADSAWFLARTQRDDGNPTAARQVLGEALRRHERDHRLHALYGELLLETPPGTEAAGGAAPPYEEAISHFRRALGEAPQRTDYALALARVLSAAGRPAGETVEVLEAAARTETRNAEVFLRLAEAAWRARRLETAEQAARRAVALRPEDCETRALLGTLCFERENYREAVECLETVQTQELRAGTARHSNTPDFSWRLGRSLFEQRQYSKAYRLLWPLAQQSREAQLYAGRCRARAGQWEGAIRIFRQSLARFGEEPAARYYLATCLSQSGRFEDAIYEAEPLETAAEADWSARAQSLIAWTLRRAGRLDDALERLRRAQRQFPNRLEIHLELGQTALLRGAFSEAKAAFQAVLDQAPNHLAATLGLAHATVGLGQDREAEKQFAAVVASAGAAPIGEDGADAALRQRWTAEAHYQLGCLRERAHDPAGAILHWERAVLAGDSQDDLNYRLALAYMQTGRWQAALLELSGLLQRNPAQPAVAFNLACASARLAQEHYEAGRWDAAVPLLEQARTLFGQVGAQAEEQAVVATLREAYLQSAVQAANGTGAPRDPVLAVERLARAEKLSDGDTGRVRSCLAAVHYQQGRFAEARAIFEDLLGVEPDNLQVRRGLALCLERLGQAEAAAQTWEALAGRPDSKALPAALRLDWAAFHARRSDWSAAAAVLESLLDEPELTRRADFSELCKLAVSYRTLANDLGGAQRIVERHLRGQSSADADSFLAAIHAQQGQLEEARACLDRAWKKNVPNEAALELYEAVCAALAARLTLADQLAEADQLLKTLERRYAKSGRGAGPRELGAATRRLGNALRAALLVQQTDANTAEQLLPVYETLQKALPDNVKVRRNLAILVQRRAIELEQRGETKKAEAFWTRGGQYWGEMLGDRSFWDAFIGDFNATRKRRDVLAERDVDLLRWDVFERLAGLHAAFVNGCARAGAKPADMKRHLEHLRRLEAADVPVPEGRQKNGAQVALEAVETVIAGKSREEKVDWPKVIELAEAALELWPDESRIREKLGRALLNRGIDLANADRSAEAESYMERAVRACPALRQDPWARMNLFKYYEYRAIQALQGGDAHGAARYYDKADTAAPGLEDEHSEVRNAKKALCELFARVFRLLNSHTEAQRWERRAEQLGFGGLFGNAA